LAAETTFQFEYKRGPESALSVHQNLQQIKIDDRFFWAKISVSFSMPSHRYPDKSKIRENYSSQSGQVFTEIL
jgi:hypothetical protein